MSCIDAATRLGTETLQRIDTKRRRHLDPSMRKCYAAIVSYHVALAQSKLHSAYWQQSKGV